LIRTSGGRLKAPLGNVRYVKLCPVEGGTGWHIVFETPEGLATLLIITGQSLGAMQHASSTEWSALARPTHRGYYAVVTPSAQATAQIDRLVRERIDWDACAEARARQIRQPGRVDRGRGLPGVFFEARAHRRALRPGCAQRLRIPALHRRAGA